MTEPYAVQREGFHSSLRRAPSIKKKDGENVISTWSEGPHVMMQEGAHVTPLGPRSAGVVLALSGAPELSYFKAYLRLRPYLPQEAEECKKASIDTARSALEFNAEANKVTVEEVSSIKVKPSVVPPRKTWKANRIARLLWSFNDVPARWADDIPHTYYDQQGTFNALTDNEGTVRKLYTGYSQAIIVHGAPQTGKTFTALGETGAGDTGHGLAPRVLDSIFEGRRQYVSSKPGETVQVTIEVALLRVWKEALEDFTNLNDPQPLRITGEGVLEGLTPMRIETQRDLADAKARILKLGKRRERRSHAIVHINLTQKSIFEVGDAREDAPSSTEALKVSTFTIVDVAAGNRMDSESQNDGKLIIKSRQALVRVFDLLRGKTDAALAAENDNDPVRELKRREQREQREQWKGNGVLLGRREREVDRQNAASRAPDADTEKLPAPQQAHSFSLPRVPYKEGRLTQLLCEQLGGCCMTRVVCCVSPFYKHAVDNTLTIDFAMNASQIRSKCFKREEKDLEKLREVNDEKIKIATQVTEVSENVQKVQKVLTDRQIAINTLMRNNTQLMHTLADMEQMIELSEQERASYGRALYAVNTLMECGPINKELQQRVQDALKEQEQIRRRIAVLKSEITLMECASGEKDIMELEDEIEGVRSEVGQACKMFAHVVENHAASVLAGADYEPGLHIGDSVKLRGGSFAQAQVTAVSPNRDEFTVTAVDFEGHVREVKRTGEEISPLKQTRQSLNLNQSAVLSGGGSDDAGPPAAQLLLTDLEKYLENHTEGLPALRSFLAAEISCAKARLTEGGCKARGQPLAALLEKLHDELASRVESTVQRVLPAADPALKEKMGVAFRRKMAHAVEAPEQPLARRLKELTAQEEAAGKVKLPADRALTRLVSGTDGDSDPPEVGEVSAAATLLHATLVRLAWLVDYMQMRAVLGDSLSEWEEAISETLVSAVKTAEEKKSTDEKVAATKKEQETAAGEVAAAEKEVEAAKKRTKQEEDRLQQSKQQLEKAKQGCCVVQ